MAGHINKRKLFAAKDCRGTIPVGSSKAPSSLWRHGPSARLGDLAT
jgi:hypothetical protein